MVLSGWAGWLRYPSTWGLGLASLAYSIQQRRLAKRGVRGLWVGVIVFTSISAFSNLLHALAAISGTVTVSPATFRELHGLALLQAVILSASLPGLVVLLGEIVSADDAQQAEQEQRDVRKPRTGRTHAVGDGRGIADDAEGGVQRTVAHEREQHDESDAREHPKRRLAQAPDTGHEKGMRRGARFHSVKLYGN